DGDGRGVGEEVAVPDVRVLRAPGEQVPGGALVGALENPLAPEGGVNLLDVVVDRIDAGQVEQDVGGLVPPAGGAVLAVGPGQAAVAADPDAPLGDAGVVAEGRVDDDLALGGQDRVHDDLVARRAHEGVVALGDRLGVVGAVQQRPGAAAVHGAQEADAPGGLLAHLGDLGPGRGLPGGGEDHGLVRVAVAGEQGDAADVQAQG